MLKPGFTGQFKKDYKLAVKRGLTLKSRRRLFPCYAAGSHCRQHIRITCFMNSRNYKGMRECHIEPDWLLVYKIRKDILVLQLIRTGTHSDLF